MNLAFVSNVVYPFVTGGAEKRIHEIGRRLADRGHNVTVYGRHYWDGPPVRTHEGIELRAVAPAADLYTDDDGRRSITEALDFATRLTPTLARRASDHDVIVASVFPYFPVLATALCSLPADVPVVTTWHEVWGDYWEDYLDGLAPGGKLVERLTARVPQHPVAVSGVTADRLAELGPDRDDVAVVPNGIDLDRIGAVPPAADGYDVLFAGRLIEDKRVELLVRAFDRVADSHDATLGVVGDGPRREAVERAARRADASDCIDVLGYLEDYEDVLAQMKAADVYAAPSTREGFGIAYLEAMAADCVVVGADHPESAAGEVIGDAGFLASPEEAPLASVLDRALGGETPETDPVDAAAAYDWDAVATRALSVYSRALD